MTPANGIIHTGLYSDVAFNFLKGVHRHYGSVDKAQTRHNFNIFRFYRAADNETFLAVEPSFGIYSYDLATPLYKAKDEREFKAWLAFQVKAFAMHCIKHGLADAGAKWSRHCNAMIYRKVLFSDICEEDDYELKYEELTVGTKLAIGTVAEIYAVHDFLQERTRGIDKDMVSQVVGVQLDPIATAFVKQTRIAIAKRRKLLQKSLEEISTKLEEKISASKSALYGWHRDEAKRLRDAASADIQMLKQDLSERIHAD